LCALGVIRHIRNVWKSETLSSEPKKFTVGLFGTLAIVAALLIFLWLLTFQAPEMLSPLVTASFFLVGGLSLSFAMVGVKIEPFMLERLVQTVLATVLNVVVIFYVNSLVPISFEFSVVDPQFFAVLIGVAEECFFRLFLCGLFYRFTNSFLIAVFGSSAVWSGYHISRYGGDLSILMIIFMCGCVLGATFLYTRSADGGIFGHALVNYIALA